MECRHCGKDWSENIIRIHEDRCKQNPANMPEEPEETDWEGEVNEYHKGGGYYSIPGVEGNIQGKEKAIKALKEADN